jgi:DNA-binding NtrC family response regulator
LNVHGTGLALYLVDGDSGTAKYKPLEKRSGMKKKIQVLNANADECLSLCALLNKHHFLTIPADSIPELEINLKDGSCIAVILDLDTIPVSNRNLKELSIKHPSVFFLCISAKRFHPELQDAIRHHIYACLNKPVDPDELLYWLRSMEENDATAENHVEP